MDFTHLLQEHFHLCQVNTRRQDQYFKRLLQRWTEENASQSLTILTATTATASWGHLLTKLAGGFATAIRAGAKDHNESAGNSFQRPKLFSDRILDGTEDNALLTALAGRRSLSPALQQSSAWTNLLSASTETNMRQGAAAVRALLCLRQLDCLLELAERHKELLLKTASLPKQTRIYGTVTRDSGWSGIVKETLQILSFLNMQKCFFGQLGNLEQLERWTPVAIPLMFNTEHSAAVDYVQSAHPDHDQSSYLRQLDYDVDQCFRILCMAETLINVCGLKPVDWNKQIVDNFLHFVGFEAWNRGREGVSYLSCHLNTTKDIKWLQSRTRAADTCNPVTNDVVERGRPSRSADPLLLRDPKQEPQHLSDLDDDDEDDQAQQQLANLEMEEMAYGLNRSQKYRKRERLDRISSACRVRAGLQKRKGYE